MQGSIDVSCHKASILFLEYKKLNPDTILKCSIMKPKPYYHNTLAAGNLDNRNAILWE